MDLVLIKTSEVEGKNGKTEEKITYPIGYKDGGMKIAKVEYKGDDPRTEYYNSKGEVGFVERTEEDKKVAKKAGFHWDHKVSEEHAQTFLETLPQKVDAFQEQQAILKQKMAEKKVKQ